MADIQKIKLLIQEYYDLESGVFIDQYTELLEICKNPLLYISRRALKHFVERRKFEFSIKHSKEDVISRMYFAIDRITEVVTQFDRKETYPDKYLYTKEYPDFEGMWLRVIAEPKGPWLEIKSIHFRK